MESFYGGKQGISFNIVQHFDGIDIPENTVFTGNYYAVDDSENLITDDNNNYIVKNTDNQFDYRWKYFLHDGTFFDKQYARGMKQCFMQGGKTTSEVGYGEYVIIDTIVNCHNSSHIDNGKIYRRGMNYQGPLGGAEYIGQVVGPKGQSPELEMDSVLNIIGIGEEAEEYPNKGAYTVDAGDMIPGNPNGGDEIIYAWADIRDESGDIVGAKIGFKFPYLVVGFTARQVHPYWYAKNAKPAGGEKSDGKFIIPTNEKPYHRTWELRIPQGVHGMDSKNIRIDQTDANNQMYVYDTIDYTNPTPVTTTHEIAPYKVISNITLADNGTLTVNYTHGADKVFTEAIKWIDEVTLTPDGIFTVDYNNGPNYTPFDRIKWVNSMKLEDNGDLKIKYNTNTSDTLLGNIKWIDNITLGTNGEFLITYNDGTSYDADLSWVSNVTIDAEGTIAFFDCANNEKLRKTKYLKVIKDISIDTGTTEGAGTQKVVVKYNTGETVSIGNPINYIIESAVTTPEDAAAYNVKPYHFLVYYAAPSKRGTVNYKGKTGWVDLGYIRGEIGGLRIIGDVNNINDLKKTDGTWKTPEEVLGANWSDDYIGWGISVEARELYIYDYVKKQWYSIGEALAKPDNIIAVSDTMPGEDLLEGGIWFVKETVNMF